LKAILGLTEEYDRFNNFRVRILHRAHQELADKVQQGRSGAGAKRNPTVASQLKKPSAELEDARNSLRFAQTAIIYTDETRLDW